MSAHAATPPSLSLHRSIVAPDYLLSLALSPDGRWVACTSYDERVHIRDTGSLELVKSVRVGKRPGALAFSPDSKLLVAGASTLAAFATGTWKKTGTYKGHRRQVACAAFSMDGSRVFGGGHSDVSPYDNSVRAWDVATAQELGRWEARGSVCALAAAPDGSALAVATQSGQIMSLDPVTLEPRWQGSPDRWTNTLRFSPSGRLYGTSSDQLLFEIDVATGASRQILPATRYGADLAISPDGALAFIAVAHGGDPQGSFIGAVDIEAQQIVSTHPLSSAIPGGIAVAPDGRRAFVIQRSPDALLVFEVQGGSPR